MKINDDQKHYSTQMQSQHTCTHKVQTENNAERDFFFQKRRLSIKRLQGICKELCQNITNITLQPQTRVISWSHM